MDVDEEREGYINKVHPAYAPIHGASVNAKARQHHRSTRVEEGIGMLIVIAGGAWAVYSAIAQIADPWQIRFYPPSPAVVCILGAVIWLHAKWRHATPAK
jgi:hypothetical protein